MTVSCDAANMKRDIVICDTTDVNQQISSQAHKYSFPVMMLRTALFLHTLLIVVAAKGEGLSSIFTYEFLDRHLRSNGRYLSEGHTPCGTLPVSSQQKGEMSHAHAEWKSRQAGRNLAETNYVIPTYIHVMQKSKRVGVLSSDDKLQFMASLNHGFRDTPFTFELYGSDSTINPTWFRCEDEASYKEATRVDGSDVLNIYVCNTNAKEYGTVGYSIYPPVAKSFRSTYDGVGTLDL